MTEQAQQPVFEAGGFDQHEFPFDIAERLRLWRLKGLEVLEAPEQSYLLHYTTKEIAPRIAGVTWSRQGNPMFLIPTAGGHEVMQILQDDSGKFRGCRVMPNADESVVWAAMSSFLRNGHSIDPANVKFGETEGFAQRMGKIWADAYERHQSTGSLLITNPLHSNPLATENPRPGSLSPRRADVA